MIPCRGGKLRVGDGITTWVVVGIGVFVGRGMLVGLGTLGGRGVFVGRDVLVGSGVVVGRGVPVGIAVVEAVACVVCSDAMANAVAVNNGSFCPEAAVCVWAINAVCVAPAAA